MPREPRFPVGLRPILLLALAILLVLAGCRKQEQQSTPPRPTLRENLTLCHGSVTNLLPRIALENGYFAAEGLELTVKDLNDGRQALDGLLRGDCHFAVCGAPPITLHDPRSAAFTILASILSDDDSAKIIGRQDRGILGPQDLQGKRIGVKQGIIGHLFLDLYLMKHGLSPQAVTQVNLEPDRFLPALESGEIDGFSMTNRLVRQAAQALGSQATVLAEPGLNLIHGILTTRADLPNGLAAAPALLRALLRAEEFVKANPNGAKAIIANAHDLSAEELTDLWARTRIEVRLSPDLLVNLDDQYRWQVGRGVAPALPQPPNYLELVRPEILAAIRPGAVSILARSSERRQTPSPERP